MTWIDSPAELLVVATCRDKSEDFEEEIPSTSDKSASMSLRMAGIAVTLPDVPDATPEAPEVVNVNGVDPDSGVTDCKADDCMDEAIARRRRRVVSQLRKQYGTDNL